MDNLKFQQSLTKEGIKMSFLGYSIKELETKLHNKEISATELVDIAFKRIAEVEDKVQAFITLDEENARAKAQELDQQAQESHKLFAMPMAIKDNIAIKGMPLTCASNILRDFKDPLYNATVVDKLNAEKAINIGKVNLDEFAMGSSTESSAYLKTRNPWNLDHVPGGSSGGSAAAVAAGEVLFTLGTDTGGSIRQPASFCGIVGMKPTYGLVSRHGLVAMASSLDQIGPMTLTVEDNARVLEVIAGHDPLDATSANQNIPAYTEVLKEDIKGLKIAVPEEFFGQGLDPEVKEAVMNAVQMFELLGAKCETVSLPHVIYSAAVYRIIASAEASTSLGRFDGIRFGNRSENATNMIDMMKQSRGEGFGYEAKKRILLGSHLLSGSNNEEYVQKAQKIRTLIKQDFAKVFENYDVIIGPTTPTPAFKLNDQDRDPVASNLSDILTVPVNLAGLPGLSLPCGFSEAGLPIGLQIIGKHFDESTVYRVAHAYEQATNHHKKRPVIEEADK